MSVQGANLRKMDVFNWVVRMSVQGTNLRKMVTSVFFIGQRRKIRGQKGNSKHKERGKSERTNFTSSHRHQPTAKHWAQDGALCDNFVVCLCKDTAEKHVWRSWNSYFKNLRHFSSIFESSKSPSETILFSLKSDQKLPKRVSWSMTIPPNSRY